MKQAGTKGGSSIIHIRSNITVGRGKIGASVVLFEGEDQGQKLFLGILGFALQLTYENLKVVP